jgi:predicted small secreted protein
MPQFEQIKSDNNLREVIKTAFDSDFNIEGSWGYSQALATVVNSTDVPLTQFEHMFASMRAYLEMNMTKEKEERYGSINLNEISREQIKIDSLVYDKVSYKITAMKEDLYASFINAYKEGYGKKDFNLTEHFKQREEATLTREVTHWFEVHHAS